LRPTKYSLENGQSVVIREAATHDATDIERIVNSVASEKIFIVPDKSRKDWDKAIEDIKRRKSLIIVALANERIVGMAHLVKGRFVKNEHVSELGILVLKDFRRKGIGTSMMKCLMDWAEKQSGLNKISLTVFATNKPAIELYKKFGFSVEGVCKKHYRIKGSFVDDVTMAKFLR